MARVNVYLPDELASDVKESQINVSKVAQEALKAELRSKKMEEWLRSLRNSPTAGVGREQILSALSEMRDELEGPR